MRILVTNDDGYKAKGLQALMRCLRPFGEITVVAPKYHQSGMSLAVSLGYKPIAVKKLSEEPGESWYYLDGTPASCVKFGLDNILIDSKPDIVVSGINHGSNAATAALYSATLGAAQEAAINGIPGIGISLDDFSPDADFSAFEELFPSLFERFAAEAIKRPGRFFNINFPNLPKEKILGIRVADMGRVHWEEEYQLFEEDIYERKHIDKAEMGLFYTPEVEDGEEVYMMAGYPVDSPGNTSLSDHKLLAQGYITVVIHDIDNTDAAAAEELRREGFEEDFAL